MKQVINNGIKQSEIDYNECPFIGATVNNTRHKAYWNGIRWFVLDISTSRNHVAHVINADPEVVSWSESGLHKWISGNSEDIKNIIKHDDCMPSGDLDKVTPYILGVETPEGFRCRLILIQTTYHIIKLESSLEGKVIEIGFIIEDVLNSDLCCGLYLFETEQEFLEWQLEE